MKLLGRIGKFALALSLLLAAVLIGTSVTAQEGTPSGKVTFEMSHAAAGVGGSWGEGILVYNGKRYKFNVTGLSFLDVGAGTSSMAGEVYNLKSVHDFEGTYFAGQAGAAVAGGGAAMSMKNDHGVAIEISGASRGVRLALGVKGMNVKYLRPAPYTHLEHSGSTEEHAH